MIHLLFSTCKLSSRKTVFVFVLVASLFLISGCDSGGGGGGGDDSPRTVLVMGDSISGAYNYEGVPPWPVLLASDQPEWNIVNSAIAGERIQSGASRLPGQLSVHSPDQVVLFYGSNNAVRGNIDSFEPSLRGAIRAAFAFGVDRVVVATIPPFYGQRVVFNGRVTVVNNIIRTVASEEGAVLADVNREFGEGDRDLFPDGIHPNLDGQRIIKVAIRERL